MFASEKVFTLNSCLTPNLPMEASFPPPHLMSRRINKWMQTCVLPLEGIKEAQQGVGWDKGTIRSFFLVKRCYELTITPKIHMLKP